MRAIRFELKARQPRPDGLRSYPCAGAVRISVQDASTPARTAWAIETAQSDLVATDIKPAKPRPDPLSLST
jgi:hypothetical protein